MPERALIRKGLVRATVAMSASVLIAFALAAYSFSVAHLNAHEISQRSAHDRLVLCHAQNQSNLALRRILILAQQLVKKARNIPPKEQLRSVEFYKEALALVKTLNCTTIAQTE